MSNLAGKAGAGIAPVVSRICKKEQKNLLSFAIMPFKFEKERIFQSGVSLKRLREDSNCTIVLDNDALLDSNPDLTQNQCFEIANNAIEGMVNSLKSSEISSDLTVTSALLSSNCLIFCPAIFPPPITRQGWFSSLMKIGKSLFILIK